MQDLLQYWHDALYRDLQCFADPRTDVDISVSGQRLEAMWWKRGKPRTEMFELSADGDFRWLGSGGHATYKTFLSSADMADLSQLAASTARLIDREPNYIATQATLDTAPDERNSNSEHAAADLLSGRITEALSSASGRTQLLFVRAGAGGGKTTLLRELTAAHAESFETTTDAHLLLYVSAQGRALSNLRDVLSSELDDLRAGFGRDALSALVRHGLIVPIIDGFDELLGAAGYGDAFGSLTEFLDSLDGEGVLLVSARSSFYEVEFIGRRPLLASRDGRYELEPVTLQAWNDSLVEQYLGKSLGQTGGLRAIQTLREQDRVLLGKPFFASQLPYFLDSHKDPDTAALGLVDFLIDRYDRTPFVGPRAMRVGVVGQSPRQLAA